MKNSNNKTMSFIRRNALYLILALCILAVGLAVTFALINRSKNTLNVDQTPTINQEVPNDPNEPVDDPVIPNEPDDPVDDPVIPNEPNEPVIKPIEFIMPVNGTTSIESYTETMVFNSTLGRYSAHLAVDFFAEEGTPVYAVYDGTVCSVTTTLLQGTTVKIDHGNGLYTIYNSLADGDSVSVGQSIKQGDVIGEVSLSNRQEYKAGAHLHFEVEENGKLIDPSKYLALNEK